jgi:hypothetical protein
MNAYRAGAPDLLVIGVNESLLAIRPTDGATVWSYDFHKSWFGDSDRPSVPVSIEFIGRQVFAALTKLVCLHYDTGQVLATLELEHGRVPPTLYVCDDRLFIYTDARILCLGPTGQLLWQREHGLTHLSGARPTLAMPGHVQPGDR